MKPNTNTDITPQSLDEAMDAFKAYCNGIGGFDELDFKEYIIDQYVQQETTKAEIRGADNLHKHIFNHFELLPRIQRQNGSTHDLTFKEGNYQAVACEYLNELQASLNNTEGK